MRFVLAGGGTAGHTSPLIATAEAIGEKSPGADITCIGTDHGLEATVVPAAGLALRFIDSLWLPRRLSLDLIKAPWRLWRSVRQAAAILAQVRPQVVVGFGGYVSVPVCLAARRARIPVVVQEQNALPGLANRLVSRFAVSTSAAFPNTPLPRSQFTGMPVRQAISDLARQGRAVARRAARDEFSLPQAGPLLLVSGGSLGATALNDATVQARDDLLASGVSILHVWGTRNFPVDAARVDAPGATYLPLAFVSDMSRAYAAADLMLARAGAATVAETGTVGLPCLFVPFPHGNGEQRRNAAALIAAGAGLLVPDEDLSAEKLKALALPLLQDDSRLAAMGQAAQSVMRPGAAGRVAEMAIRAAGGAPVGPNGEAASA